jgi:transcriptional regulator with XRE-family HTH domain
MTIAEYVRALKGKSSIRDITGPGKSGVSRGALHQILTGATSDPSPRTLANLARWFGKTDEEASRIYTEMMALCGYLDLIGAHWHQGEAPVTESDRLNLSELDWLKIRHPDVWQIVRALLEQPEPENEQPPHGMANHQA